MRYTIAKRFDFSASHRLTRLPETHPCGRLHGHNYSITLVLAANELTGEGWVTDYGALDVVAKWIDTFLDHRDLNDALDTDMPTAEYIAKRVYDHWYTTFRLVAVEVRETDKTWARYEP
jgi:6-pyruvoyltetrahydropterin/6-carboxytetrahydropterin synthase